jgi:hypothetical protein
MKIQYLPNRQVLVGSGVHELSALSQRYNCICGKPLVEVATKDGWRVKCMEHGFTENVEKKTTSQHKEGMARLLAQK